MSTTTPNLGLFKYNTTTDSAVPFSIDNALNANWDIIDQRCGASRNIGEIVSSTVPLVDAGLHLLDGSLIDGDGIYSEFVDYVADLYSDYPSLFCSESDWQTAVTTYGVCSKFVYNSTNGTVRLPKITGFVEGTTDLSALGDLVEAGLPNITGTLADPFGGGGGSAQWSGALAFGSYNGSITTSAVDYDGYNITFDASRSSSIYGNSNTVQPQTIKVLYYIVIANCIKTGITVDIDEIATDLNGKVNKADLHEVQCVVETYSSGTSWYRVYSDGWCEQGGVYNKTVGGQSTITLLKNYVNTQYQVLLTPQYSSNLVNMTALYSKTTNSFIVVGNNNDSNYYEQWQVCGYIEV